MSIVELVASLCVRSTSFANLFQDVTCGRAVLAISWIMIRNVAPTLEFDVQPVAEGVLASTLKSVLSHTQCSKFNKPHWFLYRFETLN